MNEKFYFYLPQVQSNHADAVIFIDLGIWRVFRVVNLRVDPLALVGGVVDLPGLPLPLSAAQRGKPCCQNLNTTLNIESLSYPTL